MLSCVDCMLGGGRGGSDAGMSRLRLMITGDPLVLPTLPVPFEILVSIVVVDVDAARRGCAGLYVSTGGRIDCSNREDTIVGHKQLE